MKTRHCFVANSSSSSFCIYGHELDEDEQTELFGDPESDDYCGGELSETHEKLLKDAGLALDTQYAPEDRFVLGRSWSSIGDEETGKQFKENTEKAIELVLGKRVSCGTIEEVWMD